MISGKEEYLKRKHNLDRRYGVNYCAYKPKHYSPYEGFDKDATLKRDNFTCQWCGYKPNGKDIIIERKKELKEWYLTKKVRVCWIRHKEVSVNRVCEFYCKTQSPEEYKNCIYHTFDEVTQKELEAFAWRKLNAHHLDEDATNNDLANLITLCHSCHMLYHARRTKLSIEEAQLEVKKINGEKRLREMEIV